VPRGGFTIAIASAEIDATRATVTIRALDERGESIPYQELDRVRVTIASLVMAEDGSGIDRWRSWVTSPAAAPYESTRQPSVETILSIRSGDAVPALAETAVENEDRSITYTLTAPMPDDLDLGALHRVSIEGRRVFEGITMIENVQLDLVPNGGTAPTREIVTNASCDSCHGALALHGGARTEASNCVTCHTRDLVDPNTGRNLELVTLVHKIHRGAALPSVLDGEPYVILGNRDSEHDFSHVGYPQDLRNCEKCHDASAADGLRYAEMPSLEACGSCHDRTWFGPLAQIPAGWTAHVGNPQENSLLCAGCHPATGGLSPIIDRHLMPRELPGQPTLAAVILEVTAAAGARPAVTFELSDRAGNAITSTTAINSLTFMAAGPTTDYSRTIRNAAIGGTRVGTIARQGSSSFTYVFGTALPADASGTWGFGIEGYRNGVLPDGSTFRHGLINPVAYAELSGAEAEERRAIVDDGKCSSCHDELALHGNNRIGTVQYCAMCHMPGATDAARRPAGAPPPESIDMKVMVHKIHRGEGLPSLQEGGSYVIYGYGNTPHDFGHVRYPAPANDCSMCHEDGTAWKPSTAVCTSCHDGAATLAHAELNTSASGIESCAVCHAPGREFSVEAAHLR
jgi:OmcA/MtrC family decaheme c-type cytochrome